MSNRSTNKTSNKSRRTGNAFTKNATAAAPITNTDDDDDFDYLSPNTSTTTTTSSSNSKSSKVTSTTSTDLYENTSTHNVDDDAQTIKQMTQLVETTVENLRSDKKFFEEALPKLGTDKDNRKLRTDIKKHSSQTTQWIKNTQSTLKQLSTPKNTGSKRQFEKLKREMEESLNTALSLLKQVEHKEKQHVLSQKDQLEQLKRAQEIEQENMESKKQREEEERMRLVDYQKKKQEHIFLENQIAHNEKIIGEREDDIMEIEQDIRDIHQTFKEMNMIVKHQQVGLDMIEENVERTVIHVTEGTNNLEKANGYDKRSRNLICIIMLIILILAVVLAIVLVVVLKFTLHF